MGNGPGCQQFPSNHTCERGKYLRVHISSTNRKRLLALEEKSHGARALEKMNAFGSMHERARMAFEGNVADTLAQHCIMQFHQYKQSKQKINYANINGCLHISVSVIARCANIARHDKFFHYANATK